MANGTIGTWYHGTIGTTRVVELPLVSKIEYQWYLVWHTIGTDSVYYHGTKWYHGTRVLEYTIPGAYYR